MRTPSTRPTRNALVRWISRAAACCLVAAAFSFGTAAPSLAENDGRNWQQWYGHGNYGQYHNKHFKHHKYHHYKHQKHFKHRKHYKHYGDHDRRHHHRHKYWKRWNQYGHGYYYAPPRYYHHKAPGHHYRPRVIYPRPQPRFRRRLGGNIVESSHSVETRKATPSLDAVTIDREGGSR